MKRNIFSLLILAGICIFSTAIYAQENNYIVSKYDFIPGEKVIFFDDFTSESVGDFPAQWLTNGSGEIVTSEKFPGRWFHITKMGYFIPEAKEDFTENFTVEFDFVPLTTDNGENMYSLSFYLLTGILSEPGGGGEPGEAGFQVYLDGENFGWKNWSLVTEQRFNGNVTFPFKSNEKYHIAIWVQKQRVRFYANENKVLDVPRAIPAGSKPNIFRIDTRDEAIPLICNFRIAAGLPDMRNRLLKDGKIISYGIQFDVNSDKLKPESYSTLKVIADLLKENPDIRLQIVGHTDSDGDDAANLDLSKRRGASVKNELVNKFACDPARLETDGKGETEPVADNNSAINKAKNRRVEFINIKEKAVTPAAEAKTTSAVKSSSSQQTTIFKDPRDGKTYKTVKIGTQTWMAENLAFKTGTGCVAYDNLESNIKIYGYLYNWETAKKVCPSGWHLSTREDWSKLTSYLGGDSLAGGKLKETGISHWGTPNNEATNESGFTALPGGKYDPKSGFSQMGTEGGWWTPDEWTTTDPNLIESSKTIANIITLINNPDYPAYLNFYLYSNIRNKEIGFSVRCVKDMIEKMSP
jgi:OOP family OmpA-OmpF porin